MCSLLLPPINDWHKIEVDPRLNYTINASLFFNHDAGNLDLEWLNSTGTVLGSSTSETDNESIEASILSNGTDDTYYLRVHSL